MTLDICNSGSYRSSKADNILKLMLSWCCPDAVLILSHLKVQGDLIQTQLCNWFTLSNLQCWVFQYAGSLGSFDTVSAWHNKTCTRVADGAQNFHLYIATATRWCESLCSRANARWSSWANPRFDRSSWNCDTRWTSSEPTTRPTHKRRTWIPLVRKLDLANRRENSATTS